MSTRTTTHRSVRRRRRAGYTLIEVMMALGVLTAGSVGIMALIQASTRGNAEAREMTVATQLTSRWIERLRRDAVNWVTPSNTLSPINLAQTTYLQEVPDPGTTSLWFEPVPERTSPDAATFDYYGRDTTTRGDMHYCTNVRLEWLYVGRAMRADVRVWWLRRVAGNIAGDSSRAALGQCGPSIDPNTLTNDFRVRMTYGSTIIRWTPR